MKIRQGFVSNSSSSSFICYEVVISPRFQLTEEMIDWAINETELDDYVGDEEECAVLLRRAIDDLKRRHRIKGICDDHGNDPLFDAIEGLFAQFGGGKVVATEENTEDNTMTALTITDINRRIADLESAKRIIVSNNSPNPTP